MQFRKPLTATAVALGMTFGGRGRRAGLGARSRDARGADRSADGGARADSAQFSQEQLESFVAAALEVSGIQQEAASQLMATEDQAEQDTVLQEANQQMIEAIESEPGISVPEYIAIAEAAETDQALRSQLEQMIVSAQMDQPQE
jgi:hypothetical protein